MNNKELLIPLFDKENYIFKKSKESNDEKPLPMNLNKQTSQALVVGIFNQDVAPFSTNPLVQTRTIVFKWEP